jgi:hypothetical protein
MPKAPLRPSAPSERTSFEPFAVRVESRRSASLPFRMDRRFADESAIDDSWTYPRFWREPGYLESSPWSKPLLGFAFAELRRIYPQAVLRDIFRGSQPRIRSLLRDPIAAFNSGLVFFALNAALARPSRFAELVARLQNDDLFDEAEFEVDVMAALTAARFRHRYEPLRGSDSSNPDLKILLGSYEFLLEVKKPKTSRRVLDEQRWHDGIFYGEDPADGRSWLTGVEVETLGSYRSLCDDSQVGRPFLERNYKRLGASIRLARDRLVAAGIPGGHTTVKGLFRVALPGAHGPAGFLGAPANGTIEADRLIRNLVARAAEQIPPVSDGVVLVDAAQVPEREMASATKQWLHGPEGRGYKNIVGILFTTSRYTGRYVLRGIEAVWRKSRPPPAIARSNFVDSLFKGLNWHLLTAMAWRRQQGDRLI